MGTYLFPVKLKIIHVFLQILMNVHSISVDVTMNALILRERITAVARKVIG